MKLGIKRQVVGYRWAAAGVAVVTWASQLKEQDRDVLDDERRTHCIKHLLRVVVPVDSTPYVKGMRPPFQLLGR